MSDSDRLREGLAALSHFFVGGATMDATLRRVSEIAERALPQTAMTGITLLVDGRPTTAVFTDGGAPEIDTAQYKTGLGPCLEAFRTAQPVIIESVDSDDRWIEFCRTAGQHGIRSTMSLPLVVSDEGVGALNFYSRNPVAYGPSDVAVGTQFAAQAAIVLANARAYWDAQQLSQRLSEAMASRAVIEQAKGIVMAQSKVPPDAAFELLVRASQRENRKLRDIARDLVRRHSGDDPAA